jgi:hypothetical protein
MFKPNYINPQATFKTGFTEINTLKGEDGFSPIISVEKISNGH